MRRQTRVTTLTCQTLLTGLVLLGPALPARALDPPRLPFPVQEAVALPAAFDSYDLPIGPWGADGLPTRRLEGQVDRRVWRLDAPQASLLEVLVPLRDQLEAQGYSITLDCETRACGGFDFRFATEVLPEPGMHVDLGDFRFLSAQRGDEGVGVFVSRSSAFAFVQMISVGGTALPAPVPGAVDPEAPPPGPVAVPDTGPDALLPRLQAGLPVALDDLVFASGSGALAPGDYPSLRDLAVWLNEDGARRMILVGHTDASGGMTGNVALSKKRADAVRQALIRDHGVAGAQVTAEGVGPLAPRSDNLTEEGRARNRRVEAVPAPT